MNGREEAAHNLAAALLAGIWTREALLRRTRGVLGGSAKKSQRALIQELLDKVPTAYPPSPAWLVEFFLGSTHFDRASAPVRKSPARLAPVLKSPRFSPAARFADLDAPKLATVGDLADWLDVTVDRLDWLADARQQHRRTTEQALQHYACGFAPKRSGPPRLLESPKPRLKAIQRRILRGILDHVPVHDCAHGFVKRRSCITSAQVHAGEALVAALDLKDFFLTTPLRRVHGLFRSLGYPWAVARLLTGLCSTATPQTVFLALPERERHDWLTRKTYESPHLPQGAPTSPSLANFAAWQLDVRLRAWPGPSTRTTRATPTTSPSPAASSSRNAAARSSPPSKRSRATRATPSTAARPGSCAAPAASASPASSSTTMSTSRAPTMTR